MLQQQAEEPRKRSTETEFVLTDIGEGIVEVEVLQWFVKPGDRVKAFDKLLEVQSDKATVEISSRHDGVVQKLGVEKGQMAKVGQVLVYFEPAAEGKAGVKPQNDIAASTPTPSPPRVDVNEEEKVLSTPAVRHLAKEHGIDLARIKGTGKGGRVMKSDVLGFLNKPAATITAEPLIVAEEASTTTALPPPPSPASVKTIPITGVRREMAKAMTASLTIPHMNLMEEVDLSDLHKLLPQDKSISLLSVFVKCTSLALLEFPELNATVNADVTELTLLPQHDIGIAMDTPSGLIVPAIRAVEQRSIFEIHAELARFKLAKGRLPRADFPRPTFSLSNIGSLGGTYATPLIVPPQVGIGAFGRARRTPVFSNAAGSANGAQQICEARLMQVTWAADHRVVDGATLARFSNRFKALIEFPVQALARLK